MPNIFDSHGYPIEPSAIYTPDPTDLESHVDILVERLNALERRVAHLQDVFRKALGEN